MLAHQPSDEKQTLLDLAQPFGLEAKLAGVAREGRGRVLDLGLRGLQTLDNGRQRWVEGCERADLARHRDDATGCRVLA